MIDETRLLPLDGLEEGAFLSHSFKFKQGNCVTSQWIRNRI